MEPSKNEQFNDEILPQPTAQVDYSNNNMDVNELVQNPQMFPQIDSSSAGLNGLAAFGFSTNNVDAFPSVTTQMTSSFDLE